MLTLIARIAPHFDPRELRNAPHYDDERPSIGPDRHLEILARRDRIFQKQDGTLPRVLPIVEELMRQIRDLCSSRGISLSIVLIPEETQVDPDLRRRLADRFPVYHDENVDFDLPNVKLTEALAALGIAHHDLLPIMRRNDARLFKPQDTHWNIAGNALAAEEIAKFLSRVLAVDAGSS